MSSEFESPGRRVTLLRVVKAFALAALGALFLAWPETVREVTQFDTITAHAEGLLDDSLERNLKTFLSISGIKAVLALLEGSSVGVGFDLEVGDLVQPAYDYVDFVWTMFMYALLTLSFYKLLLETGLLGTGFALMGAGLLAGAVASLQPAARMWARFLIMLGLLIAYIVPVSLLSAHYVSETYLVSAKAASAAEIRALREDFNQARDDVLELRGQVSIWKPGQSLEVLRTDAQAIADRLTAAIWDSTPAFLTYVLVMAVELLALPLLSAFIMFKSVAYLGRRLGEGNEAVAK